MDEDSARLESLETKLAFQEDMVQQLSDALVSQQARIDRLQARVDLLTEQLASAGDEPDAGPEPPPPHY